MPYSGSPSTSSALQPALDKKRVKAVVSLLREHQDTFMQELQPPHFIRRWFSSSYQARYGFQLKCLANKIKALLLNNELNLYDADKKELLKSNQAAIQDIFSFVNTLKHDGCDNASISMLQNILFIGDHGHDEAIAAHVSDCTNSSCQESIDKITQKIKDLLSSTKTSHLWWNYQITQRFEPILNADDKTQDVEFIYHDTTYTNNNDCYTINIDQSNLSVDKPHIFISKEDPVAYLIIDAMGIYIYALRSIEICIDEALALNKILSIDGKQKDIHISQLIDCQMLFIQCENLYIHPSAVIKADDMFTRCDNQISQTGQLITNKLEWFASNISISNLVITQIANIYGNDVTLEKRACLSSRTLLMVVKGTLSLKPDSLTSVQSSYQLYSNWLTSIEGNIFLPANEVESDIENTKGIENEQSDSCLIFSAKNLKCHAKLINNLAPQGKLEIIAKHCEISGHIEYQAGIKILTNNCYQSGKLVSDSLIEQVQNYVLFQGADVYTQKAQICSQHNMLINQGAQLLGQVYSLQTGNLYNQGRIHVSYQLDIDVLRYLRNQGSLKSEHNLDINASTMYHTGVLRGKDNLNIRTEYHFSFGLTQTNQLNQRSIINIGANLQLPATLINGRSTQHWLTIVNAACASASLCIPAASFVIQPCFIMTNLAVITHFYYKNYRTENVPLSKRDKALLACRYGFDIAKTVYGHYCQIVSLPMQAFVAPFSYHRPTGQDIISLTTNTLLSNLSIVLGQHNRLSIINIDNSITAAFHQNITAANFNFLDFQLSGMGLSGISASTFTYTLLANNQMGLCRYQFGPDQVLLGPSSYQVARLEFFGNFMPIVHYHHEYHAKVISCHGKNIFQDTHVKTAHFYCHSNAMMTLLGSTLSADKMIVSQQAHLHSLGSIVELGSYIAKQQSHHIFDGSQFRAHSFILPVQASFTARNSHFFGHQLDMPANLWAMDSTFQFAHIKNRPSNRFIAGCHFGKHAKSLHSRNSAPIYHMSFHIEGNHGVYYLLGHADKALSRFPSFHDNVAPIIYEGKQFSLPNMTASGPIGFCAQSALSATNKTISAPKLILLGTDITIHSCHITSEEMTISALHTLGVFGTVKTHGHSRMTLRFKFPITISLVHTKNKIEKMNPSTLKADKMSLHSENDILIENSCLSGKQLSISAGNTITLRRTPIKQTQSVHTLGLTPVLPNKLASCVDVNYESNVFQTLTLPDVQIQGSTLKVSAQTINLEQAYPIQTQKQQFKGTLKVPVNDSVMSDLGKTKLVKHHSFKTQLSTLALSNIANPVKYIHSVKDDFSSALKNLVSKIVKDNVIVTQQAPAEDIKLPADDILHLANYIHHAQFGKPDVNNIKQIVREMLSIPGLPVKPATEKDKHLWVVKICSRSAKLPIIGRYVSHYWLYTYNKVTGDVIERGMGVDHDHIPGQNAFNIPFVTKTRVTPHNGERLASNSICRVAAFPVDAACVHKELTLDKPLGRWPQRHCKMFVDSVIKKCTDRTAIYEDPIKIFRDYLEASVTFEKNSCGEIIATKERTKFP